MLNIKALYSKYRPASDGIAMAREKHSQKTKQKKRHVAEIGEPANNETRSIEIEYLKLRTRIDEEYTLHLAEKNKVDMLLSTIATADTGNLNEDLLVRDNSINELTLQISALHTPITTETLGQLLELGELRNQLLAERNAFANSELKNIEEELKELREAIQKLEKDYLILNAEKEKLDRSLSAMVNTKNVGQNKELTQILEKNKAYISSLINELTISNVKLSHLSLQITAFSLKQDISGLRQLQELHTQRNQLLVERNDFANTGINDITERLRQKDELDAKYAQLQMRRNALTQQLKKLQEIKYNSVEKEPKNLKAIAINNALIDRYKKLNDELRVIDEERLNHGIAAFNINGFVDRNFWLNKRNEILEKAIQRIEIEQRNLKAIETDLYPTKISQEQYRSKQEAANSQYVKLKDQLVATKKALLAHHRDQLDEGIQKTVAELDKQVAEIEETMGANLKLVEGTKFRGVITKEKYAAAANVLYPLTDKTLEVEEQCRLIDKMLVDAKQDQTKVMEMKAAASKLFVELKDRIGLTKKAKEEQDASQFDAGIQKALTELDKQVAHIDNLMADIVEHAQEVSGNSIINKQNYATVENLVKRLAEEKIALEKQCELIEGMLEEAKRDKIIILKKQRVVTELYSTLKQSISETSLAVAKQDDEVIKNNNAEMEEQVKELETILDEFNRVKVAEHPDIISKANVSVIEKVIDRLTEKSLDIEKRRDLIDGMLAVVEHDEKMKSEAKEVETMQQRLETISHQVFVARGAANFNALTTALRSPELFNNNTYTVNFSAKDSHLRLGFDSISFANSSKKFAELHDSLNILQNNVKEKKEATEPLYNKVIHTIQAHQKKLRALSDDLLKDLDYCNKRANIYAAFTSTPHGYKENFHKIAKALNFDFQGNEELAEFPSHLQTLLWHDYDTKHPEQSQLYNNLTGMKKNLLALQANFMNDFPELTLDNDGQAVTYGNTTFTLDQKQWLNGYTEDLHFSQLLEDATTNYLLAHTKIALALKNGDSLETTPDVKQIDYFAELAALKANQQIIIDFIKQQESLKIRQQTQEKRTIQEEAVKSTIKKNVEEIKEKLKQQATNRQPLIDALEKIIRSITEEQGRIRGESALNGDSEASVKDEAGDKQVDPEVDVKDLETSDDTAAPAKENEDPRIQLLEGLKTKLERKRTALKKSQDDIRTFASNVNADNRVLSAKEITRFYQENKKLNKELGPEIGGYINKEFLANLSHSVQNWLIRFIDKKIVRPLLEAINSDTPSTSFFTSTTEITLRTLRNDIIGSLVKSMAEQDKEEPPQLQTK